jgi:hypothetical protein
MGRRKNTEARMYSNELQLPKNKLVAKLRSISKYDNRFKTKDKDQMNLLLPKHKSIDIEMDKILTMQKYWCTSNDSHRLDCF